MNEPGPHTWSFYPSLPLEIEKPFVDKSPRPEEEEEKKKKKKKKVREIKSSQTTFFFFVTIPLKAGTQSRAQKKKSGAKRLWWTLSYFLREQKKWGRHVQCPNVIPPFRVETRPIKKDEDGGKSINQLLKSSRGAFNRRILKGRERERDPRKSC